MCGLDERQCTECKASAVSAADLLPVVVFDISCCSMFSSRRRSRLPASYSLQLLATDRATDWLCCGQNQLCSRSSR